MPPAPAPTRAASHRAALRPALACVALALVALAAYHNSLRGPFVFDDEGSVIDNRSIRQLWPPSAWFAAPAGAGVAGRPLANLSLALNHAASGLEVRSYHALNLALHATAAMILFGLVRRTLRSGGAAGRRGCGGGDGTPLALATAGLWLVHPLGTAAVNYISQRTELLAALCQLLTLYAFARATECHPSDDTSAAPPAGENANGHLTNTVAAGRRRACWLAASVGACALGMASKETTVVLPALVLLYDRAFVAGTFRDAWRARRPYYAGLAATWLVLAALMATSRLAERGVGFGLGVDWLDYALTATSAQLRYLGLALWPAPLVFDYGWELTREPGRLIASALGLAALLAVAARAAWRRREWGFAAAAYFVLLAPTSTIVPVIQQPTAENRAYLPLAAIVALAVSALHAPLGRRLWAPAAALALALSSLTLTRNLDYADEIALWADTVAKRPQNARAHGNLAGALLRAGQSGAALRHAQEAIRLSPGYLDAHTNAGEALVRFGRPAEAAAHFEVTLAGRPRSAAAHYNLATALLRAGRVDEAIARFAAALELDPALPGAHNNLGIASLQAGRVADAIQHGAEAVRLAPQSVDARYNLASALAQADRLPEAIEQLATAVRLKPDFAKGHHNLGVVLLRSGRAVEAVAAFEAALRLRPDYEEARRNLEIARRHPAP